MACRTRLLIESTESEFAGAYVTINQPHITSAPCANKKSINQRNNREKKNENCCVIEREISFVSCWMFFFCFLRRAMRRAKHVEMSFCRAEVRLSTPHRIIIRYNSYTLTSAETPKPLFVIPVCCFFKIMKCRKSFCSFAF